MRNKDFDTYTTWKGMRARCNNPNEPAYPDYGGRGISICDRWNDFHNFRVDMGPRPSPKHSIDRINNDGNYCPENCRWTTIHEQANNRRGNLIIRYAGITKSVRDWAAWLKVPKWYLYQYSSKLDPVQAIRKALKYDAKVTKTNLLKNPKKNPNRRPKWVPKNYETQTINP